MTQSIQDLERDIEQSRARLDLTIDRIQDKLSVSGIVDDILGQARQNRYASVYDSALAVVRRNPVPVMLVAAGIGWLLYRARMESRAVETVPFRPYDDAEMPVVSRGQGSRVVTPAPAPLDPLPGAYDDARDMGGRVADPYEPRRDPLSPMTPSAVGSRL